MDTKIFQVNLRGAFTGFYSLACHSERSEEWSECGERHRRLRCEGKQRESRETNESISGLVRSREKNTEMFRFAQHDKSQKLGIELYENPALQFTSDLIEYGFHADPCIGGGYR